MVTRLLIYIKHNFRFLWNVIEWANNLVFSFLYKRRLERILPVVFDEHKLSLYTFRRLNVSDAKSLYEMIKSQEESDLEYFSPHPFDLNSIKHQMKKNSFLMMGAFDRNMIVGYFFLRFFSNRRCFVGRLIDRDYRGKGIGRVMNRIMYETGWGMGFRCLSTISRRNAAVVKAHARNKNMIILKELDNDYVLVEFVK